MIKTAIRTVARPAALSPIGRRIKAGMQAAGLIARTALIAFSSVAWLPAKALEAPSAMPQEYQEIMAIVNRLASRNDLGSNEIAFTVVAGDYAAWIAEEIGLCKQDRCSYYHALNPFISHRGEIKEIIRQAYLYGDINAHAYTNGTIEIPRVTFRLYGDRSAYLACTIAHEISHARDAHTFEHTAAVSSQSAGLSEEHKKIFDYSISRRFETIADQQAWEMMTRAGYPVETCVDELLFSHRSSGDGRLTEPESTHPGVKDRIEQLTAHIEARKDRLEPQAATPGRWIYEPSLNLLRFIPLAPASAPRSSQDQSAGSNNRQASGPDANPRP